MLSRNVLIMSIIGMSFSTQLVFQFVNINGFVDGNLIMK